MPFLVGSDSACSTSVLAKTSCCPSRRVDTLDVTAQIWQSETDDVLIVSRPVMISLGCSPIAILGEVAESCKTPGCFSITGWEIACNEPVVIVIQSISSFGSMLVLSWLTITVLTCLDVSDRSGGSVEFRTDSSFSERFAKVWNSPFASCERLCVGC